MNHKIDRIGKAQERCMHAEEPTWGGYKIGGQFEDAALTFCYIKATLDSDRLGSFFRFFFSTIIIHL